MTMTTTTTTTQCGKCEGKGVIQAFRHIDNGVCYWCKGTGTLTVSASELAGLSDLAVRRIEWLNTVSPERFALLSLDKMETIDASVFACGGLYQDLVWQRYHSVLQPIYTKAVKAYWDYQKATNSLAYRAIGYASPST